MLPKQFLCFILLLISVYSISSNKFSRDSSLSPNDRLITPNYIQLNDTKAYILPVAAHCYRYPFLPGCEHYALPYSPYPRTPDSSLPDMTNPLLHSNHDVPYWLHPSTQAYAPCGYAMRCWQQPPPVPLVNFREKYNHSPKIISTKGSIIQYSQDKINQQNCHNCHFIN